MFKSMFKYVAMSSVLFSVFAIQSAEPVYYPAKVNSSDVVSRSLDVSPTYRAVDTSDYMPDFYELPEFYTHSAGIPLGDSVDPFSGGLRVVHTDATLKTNGGLDVNITRYYQHIQDYDVLDSTLSKYSRHNGILGLGWQMHFGRVVMSGASPCSSKDSWMFETQTGDVHQMVWHSDNKRFVSRQFWVADCDKSSGTSYKIVVKSLDGIRYEANWNAANIGSRGGRQVYVTKISDANGNRISIDYGSKNGQPYPTKVTTDDGDSITFSYKSGNQVLLDSVQVSGLNRINYSYERKRRPSSLDNVPLLDADIYFLENVDLPSGKDWSFSYNNSRVNAGRYSMSFMQHPEGGSVSYDYARLKFNPNSPDGWKYFTTVVTSQKMSGTNIATGTRTFYYSPNTPFDVTTVTEPEGNYTKYYHYGALSASTGKVWRIGMQRKRETYSSNRRLKERVEFRYKPYKLSNRPFYSSLRPNVWDLVTVAPVQTFSEIERDGDTHTISHSYSNSSSGVNYSSLRPYSVKISNPNGGKTTSYEYYSNIDRYGIKLASETLNGIGSITYGYNNSGNLTSENTYGVTTNYTYYSSGDLKSEKDANGNTTTYSSYSYGIPKSVSYPESVSISRRVKSPGLVTSHTNGRGKTTSYEYDGAGRIKKISPPSQNSVTFGYGTRQMTASKGGLTMTTDYDGFGRVTKKTSSGGDTVTVNYGYDANGRATYVSLPNRNYGTATSYDALDRETAVCLNRACTTYNYLSGNKVKVTDPSGLTEILTYWGLDGDAFLIGSSKGEGVKVSIGRDAQGKITSVSGNGITHTYGYNGKQFLTSYSDTQTGKQTFGHDNVGNVTSKTHGSMTTRYYFDGLNRNYKIEYPKGGGVVNYRFDRNSNTTEISRTYPNTSDNARSIEINTTKDLNYNDNDQVISEALTFWDKELRLQASYGYDSNGHQTSITYPSGDTFSLSPNAYGRATTFGDIATSVGYHNNGVLAFYRLKNGVSVDYDFDGSDRIAKITAKKGNSVVLDRRYDYYSNHNLKSRKANDLGKSSTISYDSASRLTKEYVSGNEFINISYLANQHITQIKTNSKNTTYTIGSQSRVSRVVNNGNGTGVFYDDVGNIREDDKGNYYYRGDATLASFMAGDIVHKHAYDGDGKRVVTQVAKLRSAETNPRADSLKSREADVINPEFEETRFFYGKDGLLGEYDEDAKPLREYYHLSGKTIAQNGIVKAKSSYDFLFRDSFEDMPYVGNPSTPSNPNNPTTAVYKVEYLHGDLLGTPVASTDEAGAILWKESRIAYGIGDNKRIKTNYPIGYTGHREDKSGLTYAGLRYYRSDFGRFLSPDPVPFRESDLTSINRYVYGANNPYTYVDTNGDWVWLVFIAKEVASEVIESVTGVPMPTVKNAVEYSGKTLAKNAISEGVERGIKEGQAKAVKAAANSISTKKLASDAHSSLDPIAQKYKTTAIGKMKDGSLGIASSDKNVPKPQRVWAGKNNVKVVNGTGHAEETLINAGAKHVDASRGVCLDCQKMMKNSGVTTNTPFTGKKSRKRK